MGYSCTKDAANMLGVIGRMFATDGNPNILTIGKDQYFFERGKVGNVRIEPDGTLTRFPHLRMVEKEEIRNTFADMSARNPQLLSAWACGRI